MITRRVPGVQKGPVTADTPPLTRFTLRVAGDFSEISSKYYEKLNYSSILYKIDREHIPIEICKICGISSEVS